ncbi:MAG: DUF5652 family protein [Gaiellaceae bacterium]
MKARKKWSQLSPRARRVVVAASAIEGALKIAALIDLARRPASAVRGSKTAWVVSVSLVNSLGVLPVVYFVRGRRSSTSS